MTDSSDSTSPTPSEMPDPSTSPTPTPEATKTPPPAAPRKSSSGRAGSRRKSTRRKTTRKSVGVKRGERATPPPTPPGPERPTVTEADVEIALRETGEVLNRMACAAVGVYPEEWPEVFTFSDQDLKELKGPITRIANKRAALARVVQQTDEIVVTLKLGRWAADSALGMTAARNHVRASAPAAPAEEEGPESGDVTGKVVAVPSVSRERPAPGAPQGAPADGARDS